MIILYKAIEKNILSVSAETGGARDTRRNNKVIDFTAKGERPTD